MTVEPKKVTLGRYLFCYCNCMLADAAVEYTYELKYLRPFDHLIILTNLSSSHKVNMQPNLTKAQDRMVL